MNPEIEARRLRVEFEQGQLGQGLGVAFFAKRIDSDLTVVREFLPQVDKACRETWLSDGNAITSQFIRIVLVPRVCNFIAVREGTIRSELESRRVDMHGTILTPACHHLVRRFAQLKSEVVNDYEIEAIKLEKREAREARPITNVPLPENQTYPPRNSAIEHEGADRPPNPGADLWRNLHGKFQALADEERRGGAAQKDRWLRAYCDYKKHREIWGEKGKPGQGVFCLLKAPETGLWILGDGVSENFQARVRTLAARAGVTLGCPKDTDAEDFWFHWLYRDLLENNSDQLIAASKEGGVIGRVCVASATFCARLERKALHNPASANQREDLHDAILKKKARVAEIERTLNRGPLTEYRGQPLHGSRNWRLRLEEERQHLLIAASELEREQERLEQGGRTPALALHVNKPRQGRESFLKPILHEKGWSVHDWARESKGDFHTANNYLKGKTKPYPATLKKFADALGVEVAKLPE